MTRARALAVGAVALVALGVAVWWSSAAPDEAVVEEDRPPTLAPAPRANSGRGDAPGVDGGLLGRSPQRASASAPAAGSGAWTLASDAGAGPGARAAELVRLCLDEHLAHGTREAVTLRAAPAPDGGWQLRATSSAQSPYVQACLDDLLADWIAERAEPLALDVALTRAPPVQTGPDGGGL